jgi:intracellular septation protein A
MACLALTAMEFAMTVTDQTLPEPAAETEGSGVHPLIHAGKWLVADLFSTLSFVALYALTHSVYVATGLAIALGVAQIAWLKLRRSPIDAMQWMSLGLVVVFGGASLMTRDPRFVMLKPTIIYAVIGAVMLKPGWMVRYMSPVVLRWGRDVVTGFGYAWAGMMFLTGALNVALVVHGDPKLWAWWIGVFPVASKIALFAVQYLTTRIVVRSRMQAPAPALAAA